MFGDMQLIFMTFMTSFSN